jgi:hypothetical protein
VGRGDLTGRTARDGLLHHEMTLTGVHTFAGPDVPDGTTVWAAASQMPATPEPDVSYLPGEGPLWGPGGAIFGIFWPQTVANGPLGNSIRQAPIVDGHVIFSSSGCWDARGLTGKPYHGPLTEIPGSGAIDGASVQGGFTAVPLDVVEEIAADVSS